MNWDEVGVLIAVATVLTGACVYVAVAIAKMTLVLSQIAIELRSQRDLIVQLMRGYSK